MNVSEPGMATTYEREGAKALMDGNPAVAGMLFQRAIALMPDHTDALGNLALARYEQGEAAKALGLQLRLLAIAPADTDALSGLAVLLGPHPLARRSLRRLMAQVPGHAVGWAQSGDLGGDRERVKSAYRRALARDAYMGGAWAGLAMACRFDGSAEADLCSRRAIVLSPDNLAFWVNRGEVLAGRGLHRAAAGATWRGLAASAQHATAWYNLGTYHWSLNRADIAALCFRRAVTLHPSFADALSNLAAALRELAVPDPAIWFRRTWSVAPDSAGAMTNLGTALAPGGRESRAWHRKALVWEPSHAHALNNLGSHVMTELDLARSVAWFDRAVAVGYPDGEARWNRGVARLTAGDLPRGLADYEIRWSLRAFAGEHRDFKQPLWRGEPLAGRTLLAFAEQGIGDTIQFVRYLPMIESAGRVVLECQPELVGLLRHSLNGVDVIAKGEALPAFDLQIPLMSLPLAFGSTLETIPKRVPYLVATNRLVPQVVLGRPGPRIGLVWAGNPRHKNDSNRSMSIVDLARLVEELAKRSSMSVFSLQVGAREADLDTADPGRFVTRLGEDLRDFEDTAALVGKLDMVVGVDTSVMHLVGALGRPGRLLLPFAPDWRWLLKTQASPWYPTLKLHRQDAKGDWSSVIRALTEEFA